MPTTVNMHEAKTNLSKLVEALENGTEAEIIIARNGKPAVRLVPMLAAQRRPIGLYDGVYPDVSLEAFNASDATIAAALLDELPLEEARPSAKARRGR